MIFIITPSLADFKVVCRVKKIKCTFNFNGYPACPEIQWISSWDRLLGKKITKDDEIIYGFCFDTFKPEQQKKIKDEIELRTKI